MNYSDKLRDPRWQKKRLEILQRDEFTCQYCGDKETTLHVHHYHYSGEPWEAHVDNLITVCSHCHSLIEGWNEYHMFYVEKRKEGGFTTMLASCSHIKGADSEKHLIIRIHDNKDKLLVNIDAYPETIQFLKQFIDKKI